MANALGFVKPQYEGSTRTISAAQVQTIEGKVKITYLPKPDYKKKDGSTTQPTFRDGKAAKIFEKSELPIVIEDGFDEILVVTSDEEGVKQFSPWEGQFKCNFVEFWKPNGENTTPIWKESEPRTFNDNKTGKSRTYTTLDFRAYYKISVNPFFKDVVLVHFLRYMFADNGNGQAAFNFELSSPSRAKQSTHGQKLLDCLSAGGALDEAIAWPEDGNILPEIERRLQKKNKQVMITVKEGWITDITPVSKLSDDIEQPVKTDAQKLHELGIDEDGM